jgi:hypothetical protein
VEHASNIFVKIGAISIKLRDLHSYEDSTVITSNGIRIKASEFEIANAKKALTEKLKARIK